MRRQSRPADQLAACNALADRIRKALIDRPGRCRQLQIVEHIQSGALRACPNMASGLP